jgi:hypothetical protein
MKRSRPPRFISHAEREARQRQRFWMVALWESRRRRRLMQYHAFVLGEVLRKTDRPDAIVDAEARELIARVGPPDGRRFTQVPICPN